MAKTIIGWTFGIFFLLVGFNYVTNGLRSMAAGGGFLNASAEFLGGSATGPAGRLPSIDLTAFGKDGVGRGYITQGYGATSFAYVYKNDWHNGIDIAATYGAKVTAPSDGLVIGTGNQDDYCPRRGFGKFVAIYDENNHLIQFYAHLGKLLVSQGDVIKKGEEIATVGATGYETGTHLHFSLFKEDGFVIGPRNGCGPDPVGKDVNPLSYLGTIYK